MPSLTSPSFRTLVQVLKRKKATIAVVESCCGGLINASIMAQPGASAVYFGGSVAYNTRRAKPLLLNDEQLHQSLLRPLQGGSSESEEEKYVESKLAWTRQTAAAFCRELGTDLCVAEGGATGPTFRPADMKAGFAVLAVAARSSSDAGGGDDGDDGVRVVRQKVIRSPHADREANMRLFADEAAKLVLDVLEERQQQQQQEAAEQLDESSGGDAGDPSQTQKKKKHQILDRATHLRSDEGALATLAEGAKYVVLHKAAALFRGTGDAGSRELAFLTKSEVDRLAEEAGVETRQTTFLGLLDGRDPVFGVDMIDSSSSSDVDFEAVAERIVAERNDGTTARFEDTRTVAPLLLPAAPAQNELVLHATALAQWQRRTKHCVSCGGPTILVDGGTSQQCTECGQRTWPRQDPSMIAAVSSRDGQRVLLGRSPRHPARMYTALAGFVEAGEAMERAVAREVYEETGIRIDEDSVRYVASQPWPFPQSSMFGFLATADDRDQTIDIDRDELVDAAWFGRSQVIAATQVPGPVMQHDVAKAAIERDPGLELVVPPRGVLARRLLDAWLDGTR